MKDWKFVDLQDFLEVADEIESPFKFFEIMDTEIRALVWLRTAIISYSGKKEKILIDELKKSGFKEVQESETRKILLEDLLT